MNTKTILGTTMLAALTFAFTTMGCASTQENDEGTSNSNLGTSGGSRSGCVYQSSPGTAADDYDRLHHYGNTIHAPDIVRQLLAKSCLRLRPTQYHSTALYPNREGTRAHDVVEAFLSQAGPDVHQLQISLEGTQHELVVTVTMLTTNSAGESISASYFTFRLPETGYIEEDIVDVGLGG